ncbi:MAG: hypothetical protein E7Z87_05510 [Cyanobacteria bacterium SIG26]|nr:hypothetical protein [Cyanobacteria bacterium SIG26]
MQINLFQNQNNNTNFTARLPQKVFKEVKEIPGMCCAKCRNIMLSAPEVDTFMGKLAVDSRTTIKNQVDGVIENKSVFHFLKSLADEYPRTSFYEIVKKPEVQIRIANELSDKELKLFNSVVELSSAELKKAPIVVNKLKALRDNFPQMPKVYSEVIDYLDFYATKYPDKTITQILTTPVIVASHRKVSNFYYERFLTMFDKEFKALEKLGEKLSEKDKVRFDNLNKQASITWNAIYLPTETKNMHIEEIYERFLNNLEDKKIAEKIRKQIVRIPHNNLNVDYLLYKFSKHNLSEKNYIKEIVEQVSITFEHIKAESKGGKKVKGNGLYLCKACNGARSNLLYTTILKHCSDFGENIKAQIRKIITLVKHGNLPTYEESILQIKKALNQETKGQVIIDLKDFFNFKKSRAAKVVDETRQKLNVAGDNIRNKSLEISDKKKEINNVMTHLESLRSELGKLEKEQSYAYKTQNSIREDLKDAKKELNRILAEINEDIYLKKYNNAE